MNKKGYLLSELIICFALSFVILIATFNTVISLNKKLSGLFVENKASSHQIIFNRKIADDFSSKVVTGMDDSETNKCKITYSDETNGELIIGADYIEYNGEQISIPKEMKIGTSITCGKVGNLYKVKVPIKYLKQKKDYGIELYNLGY